METGLAEDLQAAEHAAVDDVSARPQTQSSFIVGMPLFPIRFFWCVGRFFRNILFCVWTTTTVTLKNHHPVSRPFVSLSAASGIDAE